IFLITATGLGIVAILLSLARGSWISLILAIAIVVAFGWVKMNAVERKTYFASMGGLALILALVLAPFSLKIYERLTADDEGSALIRIPLMETALRMMKANPIVGVGLNAYRTTMTKYDETSIFVTKVFPNPVHNLFAHITVEIGVFGGAIFALLFVIAAYECWLSLQSRDKLLFAFGLAGLAAIVAFVVSAIKEPGSLGSVRPPLRTCFFIFGAISAVSRVRRQYETLQ
ncbi:MAG: O-antigen ligase family protein, partial [Pyrinomonadaceae bacterium]|nr:O-antigen ligase family protein [Pyrinomonadaceae bacterium]